MPQSPSFFSSCPCQGYHPRPLFPVTAASNGLNLWISVGDGGFAATIPISVLLESTVPHGDTEQRKSEAIEL